MARPLKSSAPGQATETEVLPQQPPAARWIAWLLITLFFSAHLASILILIPETGGCSFVRVPEKGADPIQAPLLAVVYSVRAAEGQEVEEGTELFTLRSDEIRSWQTLLQTS